MTTSGLRTVDEYAAILEVAGLRLVKGIPTASSMGESILECACA